jgi:hypothetical protein
VLQEVVDSATWQQIMAYHDSCRAAQAIESEKLREKLKDSKLNIAPESESATPRLVRRQLNDGEGSDPLGALTSSLGSNMVKPPDQSGVAVENGKLRVEHDVLEQDFLRTSRCASDQSIAVYNKDFLSTSRSAEQLDSPRPERSHTIMGSRIDQLKQDNSAESGSQVQRRSSFSGMMRSAKTMMSARYRGLRNTLKAASADWVNEPAASGTEDGQRNKADATDSAPHSRENCFYAVKFAPSVQLSNLRPISYNRENKRGNKKFLWSFMPVFLFMIHECNLSEPAFFFI